MKLLTVTTFLVLLVGTEAFIGAIVAAIVGITAGGFFDSAGKAARQVSNAVETNVAAIRSMLENKIVPDLQETLRTVRKSAEEFINITKRLEMRIEESLNKLDDVIGNIGKNVNHVVDIVIAITSVFLFLLCSYVRSSARNGSLVYQYLTILMYISLTTAMAVFFRVFYSSVLHYDLQTRAATIMLCVGVPIAIVFAWNLLRLAHYIITCVRPVVYFLIMGPRLSIFVTIDGPFRWVWRAYKRAEEERARIYLLITISLPWLAVAICPLTYGLLVNYLYDDVSAFWMGLLTSYLYFYFNAVCLFFCYQPPSPKRLHGAVSTTGPQRDNSRRPYQQNPYRSRH